MAQVIKTTFKFRRNLASYWAEKNPVLAEGEPCFELDTGKLKIGNGTTAYNDLSYINSDSVQIEIATKDIIGAVLSSDEKNQVSVDESGHMEVNEIGVEKLSDTVGITLVIDGGVIE